MQFHLEQKKKATYFRLLTYRLMKKYMCVRVMLNHEEIFIELTSEELSKIRRNLVVSISFVPFLQGLDQSVGCQNEKSIEDVFLCVSQCKLMSLASSSS